MKQRGEIYEESLVSDGPDVLNVVPFIDVCLKQTSGSKKQQSGKGVPFHNQCQCFGDNSQLRHSFQCEES